MARKEIAKVADLVGRKVAAPFRSTRPTCGLRRCPDGTTLIDSAQLAKAGKPTSTFTVASNEFIDANPQVITEWLKATNATLGQIANDPDTVARQIGGTREDALAQLKQNISTTPSSARPSTSARRRRRARSPIGCATPPNSSEDGRRSTPSRLSRPSDPLSVSRRRHEPAPGHRRCRAPLPRRRRTGPGGPPGRRGGVPGHRRSVRIGQEHVVAARRGVRAADDGVGDARRTDAPAGTGRRPGLPAAAVFAWHTVNGNITAALRWAGVPAAELRGWAKYAALRGEVAMAVRAS